MPVTKPFKRIWRPGSYEYLEDERYATGSEQLLRAYEVIVQDLTKVFEYVEPVKDNMATHSHRLYELLLRASTEFETNCKGILSDNGYPKEAAHLDISDYSKIEVACRLSEYEVTLMLCSPPWTMRPFADWKTPQGRLGWYQAYNAVKHDRSREFRRASLANVLDAVAGLLVILYAQFGFRVFYPYHPPGIFFESDEGLVVASETSIFTVDPPKWGQEDHYQFDGRAVAQSSDPFQRFPF